MTSALAVDALLFDGGGVLVDLDFKRTIAHWANNAGQSPESVAAKFKFDASYQAHERGEIGAAEYFASLRQTTGLDLSDQQFADGWCDVFIGLMPGAAALLQTLARAMPIYLFSNTNALHHQHWSRRYPDVVTPFTASFCSYQLGKRKPDPAAFQLVVQSMGVAPERIAFFDDLPENVVGAHRAGLNAWQVNGVPEIQRILRDELHIII
jgi:HAD superfamily hydrolase (TIGR01509 family)